MAKQHFMHSFMHQREMNIVVMFLKGVRQELKAWRSI